MQNGARGYRRPMLFVMDGFPPSNRWMLWPLWGGNVGRPKKQRVVGRLRGLPGYTRYSQSATAKDATDAR